MMGGDGDDYINAGSPAHDEVHGGAGNDTIASNNGGQDSLDGGDGNDSISADDVAQTSLAGGAGDDTLLASGFGDVLSGGDGADKFILLGTGFSSAESNGFQITDWSNADKISISGIDKSYYQELTAPDYQTALAQYCLPMAPHAVVAVQVGADVVVFAETGSTHLGLGQFQVAVLVGRTLADIDASNLVVG
jgi:Ca2+-binding RTX toxin-like protein